MRWHRPYWSAIKSAFQLWRVPPYSPFLTGGWGIVSIIGEFVGWDRILRRIVCALTGAPMTQESVIDVTPWVLSIGLGILALWMFQTLVHIHRRIAPQFSLNNVANPSELLLPNTGAGHLRWFLAGKVEAPPNADIENCTAYIKNLYRVEPSGLLVAIDVGHILECTWSNRRQDRAINIPAKLYRRYNIAEFDEGNQRVRLEVHDCPAALNDALSQPGTYRVVSVVSGSKVSEESAIEFTWGPTRNKDDIKVKIL